MNVDGKNKLGNLYSKLIIMIIRKEDTLPEVEKAVKNFVSIFG